MKVLLIGLGIYGSNLAVDLTDMGHEVIVADSNATLIESIKDKVSTAYIVDSADETALSVLPLKTVDLVIVAIGENFGASIKTVALLRKLGVKKIYARAVDEIHETILQGFKVDRILIPEQRAANELTLELAVGASVDAMRIDRDKYILKFKIPEYFVGLKLEDLDFDSKPGMSFISLSRLTPRRNLLGINSNLPKIIENPTPDTMLESDDELTILCTKKQFRDMPAYLATSSILSTMAVSTTSQLSAGFSLMPTSMERSTSIFSGNDKSAFRNRSAICLRSS